MRDAATWRYAGPEALTGIAKAVTGDIFKSYDRSILHVGTMRSRPFGVAQVRS